MATAFPWVCESLAALQAREAASTGRARTGIRESQQLATFDLCKKGKGPVSEILGDRLWHALTRRRLTKKNPRASKAACVARVVKPMLYLSVFLSCLSLSCLFLRPILSCSFA